MKRDHWLCPNLGGDSADPQDEHEDRWVVLPDDERYNLIGSTVASAASVHHDKETARLENSVVQHMPVLDIDHQCWLYESETPGHFHLYIDVPMTWEQYAAILKALGNAGVLEEGYVSASLTRKATYVAPKPWKKEK